MAPTPDNLPTDDHQPEPGASLSLALAMAGADFVFGFVVLLLSAVVGIAYDDAIFATLLGIILAGLVWLGLKRRRESRARSTSVEPNC